MKVTRKFTLALIAGILLVHAASAAVGVHRELTLFHEDTARDSWVLGRALSHAVRLVWRAQGEAAALALLARAGDAQVRVRWVWPDAQGEHRPVAAPAELTGLAAGRPVVLRLVRRGQEGVYTYVPLRVPGGRLGAIEVVDALEDAGQYLRVSVAAASVTALTLVALCAALAWALGWGLIGRPVAALVQQARRVARGDLTHRLEAHRRDELGELAREMNQMCDGMELAWQQAAAESKARIEAIEQLRHVDRLKTVGTLASGIAHELGTPINVVVGHAQLVCEDTASSASARASAEIITRQCQRMTEIIRQLMDFSRRGVTTAEPPADVRAVVRETARMLEPLARKRNVTIEVEVGDEAVIAAIGFGQAQQVVTNLAINGLHAMPAGGRLALAVTCEQRQAPGATTTASHACVTVEDTGEGMDDERRARIFEPFFTTKDVGEGTGLGLAVAYGIIEDRGGWIAVESKPGQGSRFTICLPVPPARPD